MTHNREQIELAPKGLAAAREARDKAWPMDSLEPTIRAYLSTTGAPEAVAWQAPSNVPQIEKGTERSFIAAVRRVRTGKVYTFPVLYLHAYPLRYEYECPKGNGCPGDGCDDGCPTTGWYSADGDGDGGRTYSIVHLDDGDEFLGWCALPLYTAPLPAASAVGVKDVTETMTERAAKAGWNACRKSIYAVCEDVDREAEETYLKASSGGSPTSTEGHLSEFQSGHVSGYRSGMVRAAKSIARGFGGMEAVDDDNFRAALASPAGATREDGL